MKNSRRTDEIKSGRGKHGSVDGFLRGNLFQPAHIDPLTHSHTHTLTHVHTQTHRHARTRGELSTNSDTEDPHRWTFHCPPLLERPHGSFLFFFSHFPFPFSPSFFFFFDLPGAPILHRRKGKRDPSYVSSENVGKGADASPSNNKCAGMH